MHKVTEGTVAMTKDSGSVFQQCCKVTKSPAEIFYQSRGKQELYLQCQALISQRQRPFTMKEKHRYLVSQIAHQFFSSPSPILYASQKTKPDLEFFCFVWPCIGKHLSKDPCIPHVMFVWGKERSVWFQEETLHTCVRTLASNSLKSIVLDLVTSKLKPHKS